MPRLFHRLSLAGLVCLCTLAAPVPATAQDLFEQARRAVHLGHGQGDLSGYSLRGGANFSSGVSPKNRTLLRAQVNANGGCGVMNYGASFKQVLDELPEVLTELGMGIAQNMPLMAVCFASPVLCDLSKHWMGIVGIVVNRQFTSCEQIQQAMMVAGTAASGIYGDQRAQRLNESLASGKTMSDALDAANGNVLGIRAPTGEQRVRVDLVNDSLDAVGASATVRTLAVNLLGEITLSANGRLRIEGRSPANVLLAEYERHRTDTTQALEEAVDAWQEGGTLPESLWRAIAVPGQPFPRDVLEALAGLRHDKERYQSYLQKIGAGLALARLQWDCSEVQTALRGALTTNQELSQAERHVLERKLEALDHELRDTIAKKTLIEQHVQPAMAAVVEEHRSRQQTAVGVSLDAPPRTKPPRRANAMGYHQ